MPATDPLRGHGRRGWRRAWLYLRALAAPVLLWALVLAALRVPLGAWLSGENTYDQAVLQEWIEEARTFRATLPEMIDDYLTRVGQRRDLLAQPEPDDPEAAGRLTLQRWLAEGALAVKREEIRQHLKALGDPPTKMFAGQLPLFPVVYRLEVRFRPRADEGADGPLAPITWDSGLPADASQYEELEHSVHPRAGVYLRYQVHAYNKRQRIEQEQTLRIRRLSVLAGAATVLVFGWMALVQRRERDRERQRALAQHQAGLAERLLLEGERRHAETERKLLEQRLATQAAERRALELKSQLYASIGIMAGSYAHNIKNLLVRPNDLLRRCLEADGLSGDQEGMLREVQETLGTVTERLQQILHTVRRDPGHAEQRVLDLNEVVRALARTWADLARDKWKLDLTLELNEAEGGGPLWVRGDDSHLQQAVENLLFNARDATFEERNHLRDAARRDDGLGPEARRQALIAAAGWRGRVVLRTARAGEAVVLEVRDNGAGMTAEVRRRCTETHFSTRRDNALYEGHSTGMGLGLSFVVTVLEHHHARLEIDSAPQAGTTFRVRFPTVPPPTMP